MIEAERLRSLHDLCILDSAPEPLLDSITRLASEACGVPIALLSLVDEHRQWLKSNIGLAGLGEVPRQGSFCDHAIRGSGVWQVPDATLDARFSAHPLVVGGPGVRFYAGAPLVIDGGARVGTLCVIDRVPGQLDAHQSSRLQALAGLASQALAMRRDLIVQAQQLQSEFEARLAQNESMHRALVEAQSEFVSLAEPDGRLVYVSPAYARHFGSVPEALVGRSFIDLVADADRQVVADRVAEVLATGRPIESENRMRQAEGPEGVAGGAERWVAWTNSLYTDPSGRRRLHSVGRDVTARRRAENDLRASRSLLERTGRIAGVGGWEINLSTGRMLWSAQTRRLLEVGDDFEPDEASALAFYAPPARRLLEAAVAAAIADGVPWDLELPLRTATGRQTWARVVGEAEREGGVVVRLIGSIGDITERRLLIERLDESERFIRQVTDNLPIRIAYTDDARRYRFVNQAHCERYGRSRAEIIGRTREELTGARTSDRVQGRIRQALAGQAQRFEAQEAIGGAERLMEIQLIPDIGSDRAVRGLYSVGTDITERAAADRQLRDLTVILESTLDHVVKADLDGRISYLNPAARRFFGLAAADPIRERRLEEFIDGPQEDFFRRQIQPAVEANGAWTGEAKLTGADGNERPFSHIVIGHRGADGRLTGYSTVMRDISRSVADRHHLQAQTSALRAVMEAIPAIVAVVGPDGRVRLVNSACERWTGVDRQQAVGRPPHETLAPSDAPGARQWTERALAGETGSYAKAIETPTGLRHVAGTYSPLHAEGGASLGFILVAQDVTEHKQEEVRLLQLSRRDPLTGLLNRAGFDAEAECLMHGGEGRRLALLCIDLDHFKPVNDAHGHPVGDALLRAFGQRMERLVRPTDRVARLGGDEFAILLSGIGQEAPACHVADKVVAAACQPFDIGGLELCIGASVGVAFRADANAGGWESLLARADAMLYRAKASGRSRRESESISGTTVAGGAVARAAVS